MELALQKIVAQLNFGSIPLGIKLAPYFDKPQFEKAVEVIAKYPVQFVVCVNSIGNALFVDAENECEAIAPREGLGGLGGGFVKHAALANVRMLHRLFNASGRTDIDIVGVGGVCSGQDAFELLLCGAKAVQIGTCHWTEGAACFERIATELEVIIRNKGYTYIEDFRGKLKPYVAPNRSITAGGWTVPPRKRMPVEAKVSAATTCAMGGGGCIAQYLVVAAVVIACIAVAVQMKLIRF